MTQSHEPSAETAHEPSEAVFRPVSWMSRINFINHLVLHNNVLVALMAGQCGGKSTFLNLLQQNLEPGIRCVVFQASQPFSVGNLLDVLRRALGDDIPVDEGLDGIVRQVNARQEPVLLLVDDAHHLPESMYETFLALLLQQGQSGYFHVCVAADSGVMTCLNQLARGLFRDMVHTVTLGPLSEAETRAYVTRRLAMRAKPGSLNLEKSMATFHAITRGSIDQINARAATYFSKESHNRRFRIPGGIRGGLVAVLMLIAGVVVWKGAAMGPQDLPSPVRAEPARFSHIAPIHFEYAEPVNAQPVVLESTIPPLAQGAIRQLVEEVPMRVAMGEAILDEEDSGMVLLDRVVAAPKVLKAPRKNARESGKAVGEPAVTYTVQVLAGVHRDHLERVIRVWHLEQSAKIHETTSHGRPWYILTLGNYPTREAANQAVASLPSSVAVNKPWVRPLNRVG